MCGADRWHDYSEVDCVVAVRDFGRSSYFHKPATKLYNAWLAGVPFIGGRDSAYAADGKPGRNYLRASTPVNCLRISADSKKDPHSAKPRAGQSRGKKFKPESILERWKHLLSDAVPRLAERWQRKNATTRRIFFAEPVGERLARHQAQTLR